VRAVALFAAAAIVVAGCSGAAPPAASGPDGGAADSPSVAPSPIDEGPDRDMRFVPIAQIALAGDGRGLEIRFTGTRPFDPVDPCTADYDAWTEGVDGVLEIGVFQSTPPRRACDAMGFDRTIEVELDAPFTGVAWRDLFGPYLHFLSAPPGLVELTGLPEGWVLVGERDVAESPTGRWERMYGPPDGSGNDPTRAVVLYQSFDGPVGVTGGDEIRGVTVNGAAATLYRAPGFGELVLTWTLGTDGLALVAYEPTFTADALIDLAESARPSGD
jgi:hypothetical protein